MALLSCVATMLGCFVIMLDGVVTMLLCVAMTLLYCVVIMLSGCVVMMSGILPSAAVSGLSLFSCSDIGLATALSTTQLH